MHTYMHTYMHAYMHTYIEQCSLADHGIAVLAEVSGTLPVEHQLPTVDNFGFGDGIVFLFYYYFSSFRWRLSWGIASCCKQCGST